jgi:16S rRNA (cytosine967-C5)-methyltransferase
MTEKPRQIAAKALFEWESGKTFAETILHRSLKAANLKSIDRHLVQELVYGVIRNLILLDTWIDEKARHPPGKTRARTLLRLGLYQIACMDRIPDHAAVNETVSTARSLGLHSQAGFINAILRAFLRDKEIHLGKLRDWQTSQPHLAFSHPEWLYRKWRKQFGADESIQIMQWNNRIPETYARWNPLQGDLTKLEALWDKEGVTRKPITLPWLDSMKVYKITNFPKKPDELESFKKGLFYIQDPSTLLSVSRLKTSAHDDVLDWCAAPGGKTCAIAATMQNKGSLRATDTGPGRLRLLKENIQRLGVKNTKISLNLSSGKTDTDENFDAILVDAPCSNTGVMRRRLDVRWRLNEAALRDGHEAQVEILHRASMKLKPGGRIVYSTCSLEFEENQGSIQHFLKTHPGFRLDHEQQLTPFVDGVDGAYVAALIDTL